MIKLKPTAVGNPVAVVLPEEVIARLNVAKGDALFLIDAPGGYWLTPHNPAFETQIVAAQKIAKRRRTALRTLAK